MSGLRKAWLSLALAWLVAGLTLPAAAAEQGQAGAPDCCPDLAPYYPRNQAASPAQDKVQDKAKQKKRRAPRQPAVKVNKGWSTVEAPGQESAPAQAPK
jgi:hypothetical protein